MTEEHKYGLDDLVRNAVEQQPVEFQSTFNNLVVDRIRDAVEERKVSIARQMYNYEPPEVTGENDDEFGAGDIELDNSEEETNGETA